MLPVKSAGSFERDKGRQITVCCFKNFLFLFLLLGAVALKNLEIKENALVSSKKSKMRNWINMVVILRFQ